MHQITKHPTINMFSSHKNSSLVQATKDGSHWKEIDKIIITLLTIDMTPEDLASNMINWAERYFGILSMHLEVATIIANNLLRADGFMKQLCELQGTEMSEKLKGIVEEGFVKGNVLWGNLINLLEQIEISASQESTIGKSPNIDGIYARRVERVFLHRWMTNPNAADLNSSFSIWNFKVEEGLQKFCKAI